MVARPVQCGRPGGCSPSRREAAPAAARWGVLAAPEDRLAALGATVCRRPYAPLPRTALRAAAATKQALATPASGPMAGARPRAASSRRSQARCWATAGSAPCAATRRSPPTRAWHCKTAGRRGARPSPRSTCRTAAAAARASLEAAAAASACPPPGRWAAAAAGAPGCTPPPIGRATLCKTPPSTSAPHCPALSSSAPAQRRPRRRRQTR